MDRLRLEQILGAMATKTVTVFGDFFLDRYLVIDADLAEVSVETGLTAHQVVEKRLTPGAAGTIVSNLAALGVGEIICVGVIGTDGEGYELRKGLSKLKANHGTWMIEVDDRFTPCYTKPMLRQNGQEREMERIDIKNHSPLSPEIENDLLDRMETLLPASDAVIIADQVQERNFGVVTDRVRKALAELAARYPEKIFFVDSRTRIGEFANMIVKPNKFEAVDAVAGGARPDRHSTVTVSADEAVQAAKTIRTRTGRPVFLTAQEEGIYVVDTDVVRVPAVKVEGEIDPVGAGDSCTAGTVSALCAGASYEEAALIGNLVASVTIQKLGQTGTATPAEVLAAYDRLD